MFIIFSLFSGFLSTAFLFLLFLSFLYLFIFKHYAGFLNIGLIEHYLWVKKFFRECGPSRATLTVLIGFILIITITKGDLLIALKIKAIYNQHYNYKCYYDLDSWKNLGILLPSFPIF